MAGSEANHYLQVALAVTSRLLAVCDWHVPWIIPYHNFVCRFLSAMGMQALFPYSPTLTCLAFLRPTFGKRANGTRSPSRPDTDAVLKKAKTTDAAGHGAAVATHATGTVNQLSETPDDVLPNTLSRLGPDMYQCTLRSGTITLPIMEAFCQVQIDLCSGTNGK